VLPETYLLPGRKSFVYKRLFALIYARQLVENGTDAATASPASLKNDRGYALSEGEFNFLGLKLLEDGRKIEGLETLKVNAFCSLKASMYNS
jgi:hypothetical protein